jgi:hypothetical protein
MKFNIRTILRFLVLILGIFILILGFIQTESFSMKKENTGTKRAPTMTGEIHPGSTIFIDAKEITPGSSRKIDVWLVATSNVKAQAVDEGDLRYTEVMTSGSGNSVSVSWMSYLTTDLLVIVKAPSTANYTDDQLSFSLDYTLWNPDYTFILTGILMLAVFAILERMVLMQAQSQAMGTPEAAKKMADMSEKVDRIDTAMTRLQTTISSPVIVQAPAQVSQGQQASAQVHPALVQAQPQSQILVQPHVQAQSQVQAQVQPQAQSRPVQTQTTQAPTPQAQQRQALPPREEKPLESSQASASMGADSTESAQRVVTRIKCPGCTQVIPVYTRERPVKVECPACGKKGVVK